MKNLDLIFCLFVSFCHNWPYILTPSWPDHQTLVITKKCFSSKLALSQPTVVVFVFLSSLFNTSMLQCPPRDYTEKILGLFLQNKIPATTAAPPSLLIKHLTVIHVTTHLPAGQFLHEL